MARIVIVGAGPAGASAGWHLASRGHDVTLVDRAAFPRPKTCGDWITLASVDELGRMALSRAQIERRATERAPIAHTVIVSPSGRRTTDTQSEQTYCIPRFVFDQMVWQQAVDAGCHPIRHTVRDIVTDRTLAGFDHVIDARGAHSGVANAVALRAYWTMPRSLMEDEAMSSVQIHTDAEYRRGYGWIFPVTVADNHVRINLGVGLWKADSVRGHSIADFYERFTSTNPVLQRWRVGATVTTPVGCHVGLGLWRNGVATNDVLRIGDAANLADPLTGDGIGNALLSGRLVAQAIDGSANRRDGARAWQAAHDAIVRPELRHALAIRQALIATAGKNAAAQVLTALPFLKRRVHAAFFGETAYRQLVRGGSRMAHL